MALFEPYRAERDAGCFPLTRWSLVARAGDPAVADRRLEALNELLAAYRPALCRFLVLRFGYSSEVAEDCVQSFMYEQMLVRDLPARAEAERGRFRTLLLSALSNHVRMARRKAYAQKRRPSGGDPLPLDEGLGVASAEADPATLFDRLWAREAIDRAVERTRAECDEKDRADVWAVFAARVLDPVLDNLPAPSYEVLVDRFHLESPAQAANLLITGKRMFRRNLLEVVRDTLSDEADLDEEMRHLRRALCDDRAGSPAFSHSTR